MPKTINEPTITSPWGILCISSGIDQATNNVSLYNAIEAVQVQRQGESVPEEIGLVPFGSEFVVLLHRDGNIDTDYVTEGKVMIQDGAGTVLQEMTGSVEFKKGQRRTRIFIKNQMLPITESGEYTFSFRLAKSGQLLAQMPLEVTVT